MSEDTTPSDRPPTVSVVIPAKNEARNLPAVLAALPATVDDVILVDGASVDDTVAVARSARPGIRVVRQGRAGKGNALAAGFAAARGDYIVMIDADGSMDPGEIDRYVAALEQGADYAKGSRCVRGGGSADLTRLRRWGNWSLNLLTNLLLGTKFTDLCYGYNAFRRGCLTAMALPDATDPRPQWGDGFEIETLINIRVASAGLTVREVPSFESPRRFGTSNLHTFRDGFRVLRTILRERRTILRERRVALRGLATTRPAALGATAGSPVVHPAVPGASRGRDPGLRRLEAGTLPPGSQEWAVGEGGAA